MVELAHHMTHHLYMYEDMHANAEAAVVFLSALISENETEPGPWGTSQGHGQGQGQGQAKSHCVPICVARPIKGLKKAH